MFALLAQSPEKDSEPLILKHNGFLPASCGSRKKIYMNSGKQFKSTHRREAHIIRSFKSSSQSFSPFPKTQVLNKTKLSPIFCLMLFGYFSFCLKHHGFLPASCGSQKNLYQSWQAVQEYTSQRSSHNQILQL